MSRTNSNSSTTTEGDLSLKAAQQFDEWCAYIESRLRVFFYGLEAVFDARVVPQRFTTTSDNPKQQHQGKQVRWYIGIQRRRNPLTAGAPQAPIGLQELAESIEDFRFSVMDLGLRGQYGFQRNAATMLEPFVRLLSSEDESLPSSVRAGSRKRSRASD